MKNRFSWTLIALLVAVPVFADDDRQPKHERDNIFVERLGGPCAQTIKIGSGGKFEMLELGNHGFLGIEITTLTPELCAHFGLTTEHGVMVSKVMDDSPALAAGLQVGDIVTRVDGEDVRTANELSRVVRHRQKDDVVEIEYWRDGDVATASAVLGAQERCGFDMGGLLELQIEGDAPQLRFGMPPGTRELFENEFHFDDSTVNEAMGRLYEVFEGEDWLHQMQRFEDGDMEEIQKRMDEVMGRLEKLEKELAREREKLHEKDEHL